MFLQEVLPNQGKSDSRYTGYRERGCCEKNKRYCGYFALLSNEKMDVITALELYRNKEHIEKAFGNIKDRLNLRRLLVSSEKSLDGKLCVAFVALIYLSYHKKTHARSRYFSKLYDSIAFG